MMRLRPWRLLLGLLALPAIAAAPTGLAAQARTVVRGVVVDERGNPLAEAEVFLGSAGTPAMTGPTGVFRVPAVKPGRYWIFVRRLGFAPTRRSITVSDGEEERIQIVLRALPTDLPEIQVEGRSGFEGKRLQDAWSRFGTGWAKLITREDLTVFPYPSTLVRRYLPFAPLSRSDALRAGFNPFFSGLASRRGSCPPAVSINGLIPFGETYVDDFLGSSIEAIEVYRPGVGIPAYFRLTSTAQACGLVVVWLR